MKGTRAGAVAQGSREQLFTKAIEMHVAFVKDASERVSHADEVFLGQRIRATKAQ